MGRMGGFAALTAALRRDPGFDVRGMRGWGIPTVGCGVDRCGWRYAAGKLAACLVDDE